VFHVSRIKDLVLKRDKMTFYMFLKSYKNCFKYSVLHVGVLLIYFYYLNQYTDLSSILHQSLQLVSVIMFHKAATEYAVISLKL
jgi:hypothetical protein